MQPSARSLPSFVSDNCPFLLSHARPLLPTWGQVSEDAPLDEPDLSLKSGRLVDEGPGEVKTVTQGDSFYTSGGCKIGETW